MLRSVEIPFEVRRSNRWTHVVLDVDPSVFAPDERGETADATLITFKTPKAVYQEYAFDNVRLMEWRGAPSGERPIWVPADAIRSDRDTTLTVAAAGCIGR